MFLTIRFGGAAVYTSPSTGIHAMNSFASDQDASPFCIKTATEKRKYNVESDSPFVYVQRIWTQSRFIKYGHYAHKIFYLCDPVGSLNVAREGRIPFTISNIQLSCSSELVLLLVVGYVIRFSWPFHISYYFFSYAKCTFQR
ncbi:hypothetical protein M9H77_08919 [Catharanthus roseus]|uniref:Uncharacterized protein n=1 Tax=Catharanthus roseus TaxID=4058 RepID=A0ACC0BZH6_CATRO|nr:hypothetical protein M9H77_08919 [Catharanthus roseus]